MCGRFGWQIGEGSPIRKDKTEQATIARAGKLADRGLDASAIADVLNKEGRGYFGGRPFDAEDAQRVVNTARRARDERRLRHPKAPNQGQSGSAGEDERPAVVTELDTRV